MPAHELPVAVIGAGPQATGHVATLAAVRPLATATFLVRDPSRTEVAVRQRHVLRTLFGLVPVYGGPWSSRLDTGTLSWLLLAFLVLCLLAAWTALMLWNNSRTGAVLDLASLTVEAVFWFGFALPGPVVLGAFRVLLVARAWKSLR